MHIERLGWMVCNDSNTGMFLFIKYLQIYILKKGQGVIASVWNNYYLIYSMSLGKKAFNCASFSALKYTSEANMSGGKCYDLFPWFSLRWLWWSNILRFLVN